MLCDTCSAAPPTAPAAPPPTDLPTPATITATAPETTEARSPTGPCVDQPFCSNFDANSCTEGELQGFCPVLCGVCPDETTTAPPPTNPPTSAPVTVTVTEPPTGAGACVDQPLCAQLAGACDDPAEGEEIRLRCPVLCGICVPPPTEAPVLPTFAPTPAPTVGPTFAPTLAPTAGPTFAPTPAPTAGPTFAPTPAPTAGPTLQPAAPTQAPTTLNECAESPYPCHTDATCADLPGSYACECNVGYSGSGQDCSDTNECEDSPGEVCRANADCVNVRGSFACQCSRGFDDQRGGGSAGDPEACVDRNECDSGGLCDPAAYCDNTIGSYVCTCADGFTGDGISCNDINECNIIGAVSCSEHTSCANTAGGFDCECNDGWEPNPAASGGTNDGTEDACRSRNECADLLPPCDPNAVCEDIEGSFTCTCPPGYNGNSDGTSCWPITFSPSTTSPTQFPSTSSPTQDGTYLPAEGASNTCYPSCEDDEYAVDGLMNGGHIFELPDDGADRIRINRTYCCPFPADRSISPVPDLAQCRIGPPREHYCDRDRETFQLQEIGNCLGQGLSFVVAGLLRGEEATGEQMCNAAAASIFLGDVVSTNILQLIIDGSMSMAEALSSPYGCFYDERMPSDQQLIYNSLDSDNRASTSTTQRSICGVETEDRTCTKTEDCDECTTCLYRPVDILFLLDGSSSVSPPNWVLMKAFVSNIVGAIKVSFQGDQGTSLDIDSQGVRIGLITFGGDSQVEFDFTAFEDFDETQRVGEIRRRITGAERPPGGATRTDAAIRDATAMIQNTPPSLVQRSAEWTQEGQEATKNWTEIDQHYLIIVITDGVATSRNALGAAITRQNEGLAHLNLARIAMGIRDDRPEINFNVTRQNEDLAVIQTEDDVGGNRQFQSDVSFSELSSYMDWIGSYFCVAPSCIGSEYEASTCGATRDRICTAVTECLTNEFHGPWVHVYEPPLEYMVSGRTSNRDFVCGDVQVGCLVPGFEITANATETRNTVCEECRPDTFQPLITGLPCRNWTICPDSWYIAEEGTTTTDRVCQSFSPTFLPTVAPTSSPTRFPTMLPTNSPTTSPTMAPTGSPSVSPTPIPTQRPSQSPTGSPSISPSISPSMSPSVSPSMSPSGVPSYVPSTSPSISPSISPSMSPSVSPSMSPSGVPSYFPSTSPTIAPSTSPSASPSVSPSTSPSNIPSHSPSYFPSVSPTVGPTRFPSLPPTTSAPSTSPSQGPTRVPNNAPSVAPTGFPSALPTTHTPSEGPSGRPTSVPTGTPSVTPTARPTSSPSIAPTGVPSLLPTSRPTANPTQTPTRAPSLDPTRTPSLQPTKPPTDRPTDSPATSRPSLTPTAAPTQQPNNAPTTLSPTRIPTSNPTSSPTPSPTAIPTAHPTALPTVAPTPGPTANPTVNPTNRPTNSPATSRPSMTPTEAPTANPTQTPTANPSGSPTGIPTGNPTNAPTAQPSIFPTVSCDFETEFELSPPTATTPRVCAPITDCGQEEYEAAPPTSTSDRDCANASCCTNEEYVAANLTATSDRSCTPMTVCDADSFETVVPRDCFQQLHSSADRQGIVRTPSSNVFCGETIWATVTTSNFVPFFLILPPDDGNTNVTLRTCNSTVIDPDFCLNQRYVDDAQHNTSVGPGSCTERQGALGLPVLIGRAEVATFVLPQGNHSLQIGTYTYQLNSLEGVIQMSIQCERTVLPAPALPQHAECVGSRAATGMTTSVCSCARFQTDRVCRPTSPCSPDTWEAHGPTLTTDRTCEAPRCCNSSEYAAAEHTGTTDRVCSPLTVCSEGLVEVTPPQNCHLDWLVGARGGDPDVVYPCEAHQPGSNVFCGDTICVNVETSLFVPFFLVIPPTDSNTRVTLNTCNSAVPDPDFCVNSRYYDDDAANTSSTYGPCQFRNERLVGPLYERFKGLGEIVDFVANPGNYSLQIGTYQGSGDVEITIACQPSAREATPLTGHSECPLERTTVGPRNEECDCVPHTADRVCGTLSALSRSPTAATTTRRPPTSPPTNPPPPPTNNDGSCPRNCGTEANGGGTCRANGRCLSCNANKVIQGGRCYASIACKGRRIQSGSQTGSTCRCLDDNCHYCNRRPDGDTCKVWPRVPCLPRFLSRMHPRPLLILLGPSVHFFCNLVMQAASAVTAPTSSTAAAPSLARLA